MVGRAPRFRPDCRLSNMVEEGGRGQCYGSGSIHAPDCPKRWQWSNRLLGVASVAVFLAFVITLLVLALGSAS